MKTPIKERLAIAERENTVLSLALHDLAHGAVKWFGHSRAFSVGVSSPASACGGVAICKSNGSVSADYFEHFCREQLAQVSACITGENNEYNRELICRRNAIESAQAYASEQIKA